MVHVDYDAGVVQADMCRPQDVLSDPVVKDLIDFSRPVGLARRL